MSGAVAADETTGAPQADAPPEPPRQLNVGVIGVGGQGAGHVRNLANTPTAKVVALCDVDVNHLVHAARICTDAKVYVDFRDMLRHPELHAVLISTPDHTHAVMCAAALRAGKHVYCEKPLTHTVAEARAITDLAQQSGLVTQLGIQMHAPDNFRRVVELLRAGAIGTVRDVHIWHQRERGKIDTSEAPPPATLNYDLWLGPVPPRPYKASFHPFYWRQWWAFGTGMLGDIGCHLMDAAFWALDLKYPTRVSTQGAGLSDEFTAEWTIATYEFPARGEMPPVKLTWYDHPQVPPDRAQWPLDPKYLEGVMFIGEQGMLFTNLWEHMLLPQEKFASYERPPQTIASSPGHMQEWIDASLANDPAAVSAPFAYGGPLTECALLGTVAFRAQQSLEWDAANLRIPNAPDAERFLADPYRPGWEL